MRRRKIGRAARDGREVDRPDARDARTRKVEKLGQQARQPVGLTHNEARKCLLVGRGPRGMAELFYRAPYRRKRIANFMRERRAQLRHGLETLRAAPKLIDALLV